MASLDHEELTRFETSTTLFWILGSVWRNDFALEGARLGGGRWESLPRFRIGAQIVAVPSIPSALYFLFLLGTWEQRTALSPGHWTNAHLIPWGE